MAQITVRIEKITESTQLLVRFTVLEADEIDPAIFVIVRETNQFDRVASVYDLDHVYDSPVDGEKYFRDTGFEKTFEFAEVTFANRFVEVVTRMINDLIIAYDEGVFDSSEDVDFPLT